MAETLRSDGKAVEVTYLGSTPVAKGTPINQDGFHGITMAAASSGDVVAIEIAQREHELTVPAEVTAAKGDILYLSVDNEISNTNTNRAFLKVTVAKDSNNVVWGILLPQGAESV